MGKDSMIMKHRDSGCAGREIHPARIAETRVAFKRGNPTLQDAVFFAMLTAIC
jgi:hypothetical protein